MARLRIHLSDGGRQTDREYKHTSSNGGLKRPLMEKSAFCWSLDVFSFYSTAAEPQLCCVPLRNYSARHWNLRGRSWFETISVVVLSSASVCVCGMRACVWLPALYHWAAVVYREGQAVSSHRLVKALRCTVRKFLDSRCPGCYSTVGGGWCTRQMVMQFGLIAALEIKCSIVLHILAILESKLEGENWPSCQSLCWAFCQTREELNYFICTRVMGKQIAIITYIACLFWRLGLRGQRRHRHTQVFSQGHWTHLWEAAFRALNGQNSQAVMCSCRDFAVAECARRHHREVRSGGKKKEQLHTKHRFENRSATSPVALVGLCLHKS